MAATALLFDLDGTIWDSFPCYGAALCAALRSTRDAVVARLRSGENAVRLAQRAGLSDLRFTNLCRRAIAELRVYPGVLETLKEVHAEGIPLGVVTNIPQRLILPMLSHVGLDEYFASVICAAGKPSANGIFRALAQVGVNADERVFYVGDLLTDAQAAARAGVSFAWAAYGYGTESPSETTVVLENFSNILSLL